MSPGSALSPGIGGNPWTGEAATRGAVHDPATGQVAGYAGLATAAEVEAAV